MLRDIAQSIHPGTALDDAGARCVSLLEAQNMEFMCGMAVAYKQSSANKCFGARRNESCHREH